MPEVVSRPHADERVARPHLIQRLARETVVAAVVRHLQYLDVWQARAFRCPRERIFLGITAEDGIEPPARDMQHNTRIVRVKRLARHLAGRP